MAVDNAEIARQFNMYADLLEIKGENPFRIRAYRNGARVVSSLSENVVDLIQRGVDLSSLPGIGKDLAAKIEQIVRSGRLEVLESMKEHFSPELVEFMAIVGLGGKRTAAIHSSLGVQTLEQLEKAALEHKICKLPGFGEKIEKSILEGIQKARVKGKRVLLKEASQIAHFYLDYLQGSEAFLQVTAAGSYRRKKESVGDLDILAICKNVSDAVEHFCSYPEVSKILSRGQKKSSVLLRGGMQVDLRIIEKSSFGAALHYFTGSKAHNISMRRRGIRRGLKVNEYGIFRGEEKIAGEDEEEVYSALGLPWIEPELREDRGEIEAAQEQKLPVLVKRSDIRGDLHVHTNYTDGRASLEQMVEGAIRQGYSYVAITDHSKRITIANGMDERRLRGQLERIDKLNQSLSGFTILKGIEVDILEDGSLDLPDSVLKELDIVVCSVHSRFNLSSDKQTERIKRAMENRYFNIFAHPTGRLINRREPYLYDHNQIFITAGQRGCFLEVNSSPDRLDATDSMCHRAREAGVRFSVSTDAHAQGDYDNIGLGIGQARRGWLEASDVINTLSVGELKRILSEARL
ncbi:DNA polymerase III [Chitinispirillum alkaliphilum]|nr:DNA polymerase III [Chitinispirillum alkaliphilum]